MSPHLLAGLGLLATATASPPVAAAPIDLLSHRAAYRLSLASSGSATALASVRGALVLEWRADCSGWLSQQRLGFVAQPNEGEGFSYDVRFSSWEAPDYTRLRFHTRHFEDSKTGETFSGAAALNGPGGDGEVRYSKPEEERIELPAGTLFPTEHVRRLIEAARAGERIVNHYVFDGSGAEALNKVTAVIGPARISQEPGAPPAGGEERRWPVSLAYYDVGKADSMPEFEITYELSERGILRDIVLDYGEFALRGELEKLETLAEPACR